MEISQSHRGTNIDTLTDDMYGIDGIYTYEPDTLLTMCYADCVPVYFYSEKHHYVGLAHMLAGEVHMVKLLVKC